MRFDSSVTVFCMSFVSLHLVRYFAYPYLSSGFGKVSAGARVLMAYRA